MNVEELVQPVRRASRITDIDTVLDCVKPGMTIGIGGLINSGHPMLVVRGLIKRRLTNLTVVGAASSGLEVDLLIAAGCASKVITPYISAEKLSPIGPAFRKVAEAGEIEVFELDEAHYYCGLRAAAQRVPFNPWKAGVGTSFPDINPAIKVMLDPINGETVLAIPAIDIDIAFLHAAVADQFGNVQHYGTGFGDRAIHAAADETYVQVEKIVSNEHIKRDPSRTSVSYIDGVIRAPFGAHPFSSQGFYREDSKHILEYVAAAREWAISGNREQLDAYIERYIFEPADYFEYLERIGIETLLSLHEF